MPQGHFSGDSMKGGNRRAHGEASALRRGLVCLGIRGAEIHHSAMPPPPQQQQRDDHKRTGVRARRAAAASAGTMAAILLTGAVCLLLRNGGGEAGAIGAESRHLSGLEEAEAMDVTGIAASSSMWGISPPLDASQTLPAARHRRRLFLNGKTFGNLRAGEVAGPAPRPAAPGRPSVPGAAGGAVGVKGPTKRPLGEPEMLNNFSKTPLPDLDLDDVLEGHIWIPVSVEKFDRSTTDPLVKMCQVNYAKYSSAPWLLPMGGLLSLNSGCADINKPTVQVLRVSTLERVLREGPVEVARPTGFIFHETRCGSTLVANMLASVETNVMWSESTGPWKVMHTCPKCDKAQIVPWLRVVMDAMSRSARHNHFYFKFQSSEDIGAVTAAFPETPWVFIFREPVEVMMSRLGAQRIGMEGMEKEVAARVEKGMKPAKTIRGKALSKASRETTTAQQLSGLCQRAITAFDENPGKGMMMEYTHLPDGILKTVLPKHFNVQMSEVDRERMMNSTKMYSKVASFSKGSTDSKFTADTGTKHDAASVAVTEAAQKLLYPHYYKLQSLQTWLLPAYQ